ncbi:hypothetical protein JCM8208_000536 [Rhodotorula glutinis]
MSSSSTPEPLPRSPTPPHELAVAQQLPQSVIALIAHHLTVDSSEHRHDTFADRREDARRFARVCRAWRAAGTAAAWREVEIERASARLVDHLEAHPELYKHIESISAPTTNVRLSPPFGGAQVVIASCPRVSRLELRCDCQPGSAFQALQDAVDLSKLVEVVTRTIHTPWISWHRYATADRLVSTILLFAFLRACRNLRHFAYVGPQEHINETVDVPCGRRIKVQSLALDIQNPSPDSETDRRSSSIRSRFLLQFDLGNLIAFKAHVNLRDNDNLAALDRMVNLETLRLVDDHGLDVVALHALGAHIVRLVKLHDVDLSAVPEAECPTSPAVLDAVQRLLDALPASVEHLALSVPLPEPFAEALLEGRDGLEHFHARIYDPLDVRPEAREVRWRKTVEPVYESADEWDELDEEADGEGL